ncbi:GNAT family N-acetyltransferase [Halobacteriovorax sp. HFRX-2_2]|uniref:GNAT family N-acetyltransferase n=3 Tax=unclassified Halobacteriovorax TaxID=2639665 RepID=UPI00371FFCBB
MVSENTRQLADKYSLRSLINSMARDYVQDKLVEVDRENGHVRIGDLSFEIDSFSPLGGHRYTGKIYLNGASIDFDQMLPELISHLPDADPTFIENIINSRNNIELILSHNSDVKIDSYLSSEQKLLLGHPFHPYPKCKKGMNEEDLFQYSPELSNGFKLTWIKCQKDMIQSNGTLDDVVSALNKLAIFDLEEVDNSFVYIPMHPWQWRRLSSFKERQDICKVIEVSSGKNNWFALSSLRSLYNPDAPYLVKYSMDVKLTNSIRHLQPEEAIRGMQMETVFKNEGVSKFSDKFHILYEPFYVALRGEDGSPIIESTLQLRENFVSDNCLLLGTLAEENPFTGKSHLLSLVEDNAQRACGNIFLARKYWFEAFLENVVGEFITLSEDHGILLGAHMQNIILKMNDGLPVGTIYRDCQGTGFTAKSVERFGTKYEFISESKGNILSPEDVNKVYTYYLIINSVFNTIISLANGDAKAELFHLTQFRNFIYKNHSRSSFLSYLIESDFLYQKGNFRCCVSNINENTIKNPWDIYNRISNPIKALLRRPRVYEGELYQATSKHNHEIVLRAFDMDKDLLIFHEWHNKKYVYEFWEMNKPLEELREYVQGLKDSPYQLPIIVDIDGEQAGYFEVYWGFDDRIAPYCNASLYDRGIHILIGEEKFLGTRAVFDSIFHLTKFLFEDDSRTQKVWGEPRVDNKKVLTLARLLPGWEHKGVFSFPHKTSNLLEADRTRFFSEMKS